MISADKLDNVRTFERWNVELLNPLIVLPAAKYTARYADSAAEIL